MSYDHRDKVLEFLPTLNRSLDTYFQYYEIILVNDTHYGIETSKLKEILPEKAQEKVMVLDFSYHHGREKAMTAACDIAIGDFAIEFDYPVIQMEEWVPYKLYEDAVQLKSDIFSYTSKKATKLSSLLFYALLRKLRVTPSSLKTESIRILSRRALNKILKERRTFRFRKILYVLSGYEYKTKEEESIQILSDSNDQNRLELAMDILMSFSKFGTSVSRYLAIFFLISSLGVGLYSIIVRYLGFPVSEGWTTIMMYLTFGFSGIFAILGIVSRTLQLILQEVQAGDPYSIKDIKKLSNYS